MEYWNLRMMGLKEFCLFLKTLSSLFSPPSRYSIIPEALFVFKAYKYL